MVTTVASYYVTPNQATPKDPLWLSDSDQIGVLGHVSSFYIYKANPNEDTIEKLRNSLSEVLVYYYPLAGRLSLTKSGRMEVDCNAKGVTLIEAQTIKTLADFGDFSPSESTDELVPKVDYVAQPIEDIPIMLLQLTRFHGGEGVAIGSTVSHPLMDAASIFDFINRWAKLTRGEALDPKEIPFLDRTLLRMLPPHQPSISSRPRVVEDQPEWKPVAEEERKKNASWSGAVLKLTSSQVEMLKKMTNTNYEPPKESGVRVRPYSRFESIAAHIWRCASKARDGQNSNQPTLVRFSINFRNRIFTPTIPENYFGNALVRTVTPKCHERDIISKPLSYAAQNIREAVNLVTDEYIKSQLSVLLGEEQLDHIRAFFMGKGQRVKVAYAGDHNFVLTSLMTMPVYDADFGWGKAMLFTTANVRQVDSASILPSPDGDGIVLNLFFQTPLIELFKRFFYEDLYVSSL